MHTFMAVRITLVLVVVESASPTSPSASTFAYRSGYAYAKVNAAVSFGNYGLYPGGEI